MAKLSDDEAADQVLGSLECAEENLAQFNDDGSHDGDIDDIRTLRLRLQAGLTALGIVTEE